MFHSAYYLWRLAQEIKAEVDAAEYLDIASRYRRRLQQRSKEAEAFDAQSEAKTVRSGARSAARAR